MHAPYSLPSFTSAFQREPGTVEGGEPVNYITVLANADSFLADPVSGVTGRFSLVYRGCITAGKFHATSPDRHLGPAQSRD
jgi:hypothetical protein